MQYNPKDASSAIPAGIYDASILSVHNTDKNGVKLQTKSGDDMQRVVFEVYAESTRNLSQYFSAGKGVFRYRELAKAIGQGEAFKAGTFNAMNHLGTNLKLTLSIEEHPQYGEQNRIDEFAPSGVVATERRPAPASRPVVEDVSVDDIPF